MIKQLSAILIGLLLLTPSASAQHFDEYFEDATLRIDYVFAGNAKEQHIYLDGLMKQDKWAGRKNRLGEVFLRGNGQLTVRDHASQQIIYTWSFSTLFQEWLQYDEANKVSKAFDTSYNIPFPKHPIDINVTLTDIHCAICLAANLGRESCRQMSCNSLMFMPNSGVLFI